jgi:hypothetical protein
MPLVTELFKARDSIRNAPTLEVVLEALVSCAPVLPYEGMHPWLRPVGQSGCAPGEPGQKPCPYDNSGLDSDPRC